MDSTVMSFEEAQEMEFRRKVTELQRYKYMERRTDDAQWTERELRDDIIDELDKLLKVWVDKNKYRAQEAQEILFAEGLYEHVMSLSDEWETVIDAYNLYRNIDVFEEEVISKAKEALKNNLVT